MSGTQNTITTVLGSNAASQNISQRTVFIGNNEYWEREFTNAGSEVTLQIGLVLGMIGASNKVTPLISTASDGSELPIGILTDTVTVAASATVTLRFCVAGDVARDFVNLNGAQTLTTVVDNRTIEARLLSDTGGIYLVASSNNTLHDNT